MAQPSVFLDVQIWVRMVEFLRTRKAPTLRDLSNLSGAEKNDCTRLLLVLSDLRVPVSFGQHIHYNIVRVLVERKGWRRDEATKWADFCESFCRNSGGAVVGPVERNDALRRDVGYWCVEDLEDGQVVRSALTAGAAVLASADNGVTVARVDGLRVMDLAAFYAKMREFWQQGHKNIHANGQQRPAA